jgi:hypothetical protein
VVPLLAQSAPKVPQISDFFKIFQNVGIFGPIYCFWNLWADLLFLESLGRFIIFGISGMGT